LNCDDDFLTIARMTIKEICSADDKEDKAAENEEEFDEESWIPSFGRQFPGLRLSEGIFL
jgi:hypothetical protein